MENVNPYESSQVDLSLGNQTHQTPKLFAFNGRVGRLRFQYYSLIVLVLFGMLGVGAIILITSIFDLSESMETLLPYLVMAPMIIAYGIVAKRRFHDLDEKGWYALFLLVPLVNIFFSFYLALGAGSESENEYGLPPSENTLAIKIGGSIFIVIQMLLTLNSLLVFLTI